MKLSTLTGATMKRNGFSMLEMCLVMSFIIVLALMLVMKNYGGREIVQQRAAELTAAETRLQVVAAWMTIDIMGEKSAIVEMRLRQPTGDLPAWDSVEAAELVGLNWKVTR